MTSIQTPGVYINEVCSLPNAIVPVATAVPAFIGYTPQAEYQGVSYLDRPMRISSLAEFQAIYGLPDPPPPADPAKQYSPQYDLVPQATQPRLGTSLWIGGAFHAVLPDPATLYFLYNSLRLFFLNGGSTAWIVSVGTYGPASGQPIATPTTPRVNPNVKLADLLRGLALLKAEVEPTLYVCPDATLLSEADNATLMQAMLQQANEVQTALCLFDVINGDQPDPAVYTQDIATFRNSVGSADLKYGAAYYPFIETTVVQPGELDYTNLFGGDIARLAPLLDSPASPDPAARAILDAIQHPPATGAMTRAQLHAALLAASPTYTAIIAAIQALACTLPPSGAMAGVYAVTDSSRGVWSAPANVGIVGATDVTLRLSDTQQAELNVDAVSGKSVNAIRVFNGLGLLVWGARTLDGNSNDWRYVPVRRTVTYIEQSVKQALQPFVFAPNDANTWRTVQGMIADFLTGVWQQGGLQGAKASDGFQVSIGLGSTMTAQDLLDGVMRVTLLLALVRPAEFIVVTIEQQMTPPG
ncbi:phage tail sheath family protein [Lysobacter brunescens]|uniref:Phage tail sheath family protein n=1 Tax=Lysobacter brunescens TaxID=262323 RepID=A0ABW2YA97_9GAMM